VLFEDKVMKFVLRLCGKRWITLVVLMLASLQAGGSELPPEWRDWLRAHEPIVVVSQTDYPPFEFVDEEGEHQGMCIDLVRWIARQYGFTVQFVDMPFADAQQAVLDGRADVLTSLFYSEERAQRFGFSSMTWQVPAYIFVQAARPDIRDVSDLQGKRIAMQRGDYAVEYLRDAGIEYEWVPTESFSEAAHMVIRGGADAMIGDQPIVLYYLYSQSLAHELKSVGAPLYVGVNGMATLAGQSVLLDILNEGLARARESGRLDQITESWLGTRYTGITDVVDREWYWIGLALLAAVSAITALLLGWAVYLRRSLARRDMELIEARNVHAPVARSALVRALALRIMSLALLLLPMGILTNYLLRNHLIMPTYLALENKDAERALGLLVDSVRRETRQLERVARDWAYWDATLEFVETGNPAFVESNLMWPSISEQSHIDVLFLYDRAGEQRFAGGYDPVADEMLEVSDIFADGVPPVLRRVDPRYDRRTRTGLVASPRGPVLLAALPILSSDAEGPAGGMLVMGRFLRSEVWAGLAGRLDLHIAMGDPVSGNLSEEDAEIFSRLEPGRYEEGASTPSEWVGHKVLADFQGRPTLLLTIRMPRELVQEGVAATRFFSFLLFEFLLVIFIAMALWFTLSFKETLRRQSHIESLVVARTGALQDSQQQQEKLAAQLMQAQKMEAVGRLAGGVAHDFNNMLGVILGNTELALESTKLSEPVRTELEEIKKAATRSANLTRQLLAFARKQTVNRQILNLNETVEGMLNMLRRLIGENVQLEWRPGPHLRPLKMDPSQIDQIMVNLCINARDAIGDEGVVTIETSEVVFDDADCRKREGIQPGHYIRLLVADTGCGMDEDTLGHLFEPFFTTKEVGKGTGLGLPTVYGIVRQNNGLIEVTSEPGKGSRFILYLPGHDADADASKPSSTETVSRAGGTETILLVEDEPAILNMTSDVLEHRGYTVLAAPDPARALQIAEEYEGRIDLLLADVVMPGMNGRDLAKAMDRIRPGTKRLFMSGHTADILAQKGLTGNLHFIQKPFSISELVIKVREALAS
jgi:signal transduction histidine kinase/ABC-type amino acid transport substrate-binding protein